MSGARIEFTVDTVTPTLQRALRGLQGDSRDLLLNDIGEYLLRSTRERGKTQRSPRGAPWVPLSDEYKKYKTRKRPGVRMLVFDFHMQGDQLAYQVVGDNLFVGTNAVYGARHQFGDDGEGGIPARPWLGLSDDDEEEIALIVDDHLMGLFSVD
ncbi:phage virion morphogenesis protein [Lysobacter yananisis]|uniref:Phage virion morphogenesis protein n=1 Tax=Lysobacter yananisis TaxID=1003114 RepID=A0ABY9PAA1_9GAMM|nr:phage virion morphogenesis protein [Lysobacter yananisis]WMT03313.1 phage virion morphogenesis protein [Lysobacter yananisis]